MSNDNYEGDFLSLISRKNPDATLADNFKRSWMTQGRDLYEIEHFALPFEDRLPSGNMYDILRPFLRSDHAIFWRNNMPAIFISDTGLMFWYFNNLFT